MFTAENAEDAEGGRRRNKRGIPRGDAFTVKLDGRPVDALIPAKLLKPGSEVQIEVMYT